MQTGDSALELKSLVASEDGVCIVIQRPTTGASQVIVHPLDLDQDALQKVDQSFEVLHVHSFIMTFKGSWPGNATNIPAEKCQMRSGQCR